MYLHLVILLISSQTTMEHEVACLDITPTRKKSNYYIWYFQAYSFFLKFILSPTRVSIEIDVASWFK